MYLIFKYANLSKTSNDSVAKNTTPKYKHNSLSFAFLLKNLTHNIYGGFQGEFVKDRFKKIDELDRS